MTCETVELSTCTARERKTQGELNAMQSYGTWRLAVLQAVILLTARAAAAAAVPELDCESPPTARRTHWCYKDTYKERHWHVTGMHSCACAKAVGGAPFESHGDCVAVQVFARFVTQSATNRAEEVRSEAPVASGVAGRRGGTHHALAGLDGRLDLAPT